MEKKNNNISEVEIHGESYKILNEGSPQHTQSIAKYVNDRMKEISQNTSTVSSMKVAVLAALNIADELFKTKKELDIEKETVSKETDNLYRLIQDNTKS